MKKISCFLIFAFFACFESIYAQKSPTELSVMSFNIRYGDAQDGTNSWRFRAGYVIKMIEEQEPDVMGLQEALKYQMDYLKEWTKDYEWVGKGREDGKKEGEHMAILYNKKTTSIIKWGTFWLSETPDKPSTSWESACRRTATWALMKDKEGNKFWFVNTHLDHVSELARINGLALICEKIDSMNPEGYPMVLTGDFNTDYGHPSLNGLNSIMKDCRDAAFKTDLSATFNGWGKDSSTIDYIYFSGFSSCLHFEVINKGYEGRKFISDHYPIKSILIF